MFNWNKLPRFISVSLNVEVAPLMTPFYPERDKMEYLCRERAQRLQDCNWCFSCRWKMPPTLKSLGCILHRRTVDVAWKCLPQGSYRGMKIMHICWYYSPGLRLYKLGKIASTLSTYNIIYIILNLLIMDYFKL